MVGAFEELRKIEEALSLLKERKRIVDYRLILKLNMTASLYVVMDKLSTSAKEIESISERTKIVLDIEIIPEEEFTTDEYYKALFQNAKRLDFGLRRSLSSVLDDDEDDQLSSCPIVSFYSYKGGVGRTTALALFASYYSLVRCKKVFIIDCDFEAPGMINFFGINNEEIPKNGIVEYIKDKEALLDINLREDYVYEVSKKYTGDGEIYLLPAGNIFDSVDRGDYIEALSRIDIHSGTTIIQQLKSIMDDINSTFHPDVILIDSRTGYSDVFGITANKLSNIVVGFFGNNAQNRPGLHFFLDTLLKKTRGVSLTLVLSIISSSFSRELGLFRERIYEYIESNLESNLESLPALPVYCLSRYASLEKIGTADEDPDDFITLIQKNMLSDYMELFVKLDEQIKSRHLGAFESACSLPSIEDPALEHQIEEEPKKLSSASPDESASTLKEAILKHVYSHFPEPYAENIEFTDDFLSSNFYFRKCMEDIFKQDKFLLLGGKGTGKTAFYQALRQESFFKNLQKRSQKEHLKYKIINIISMPNETEDRVKFIDVAAQFPQSEIKDDDFFYRRFWEVMIWNAIRLDDQYTGFKSNSNIEVRPIRNDNSTAEYMKKYIFDDKLFSKIEQENYDIDSHFKKNDIHTMITFDQLDLIIKPNLWSKAVSPLIRFAQNHGFSRILPKLFIRRDLFNKLGNLTNKASLENQAINLEWGKDELFAFFFKVIFAHTKEDFFNYARNTKTIVEGKLTEIRKRCDRPNSYNQLPPEEHLLRPLVEVFFGKYADEQGKYGEMYEWIYRNLCNSDGTISLRPFLDLIKYAIAKQYERTELNSALCPLLSYKCFNADVREKAVERYFSDLAGEEGNEGLRAIIYDIRNDRVPKELKQSPLLQDDFEKLLRIIIQQHDELKDKNLIELEDSLKLNGIIFVGHISGGKKKYSFAYLYKYFLGLRSPKKRSSRWRY
jgi:cellulose biosynthesis protein BcsQ